MTGTVRLHRVFTTPPERVYRAFLDAAAAAGVASIAVHAITDGRDTPPKSAPDSLRRLDQRCGLLGRGARGPRRRDDVRVEASRRCLGVVYATTPRVTDGG